MNKDQDILICTLEEKLRIAIEALEYCYDNEIVNKNDFIIATQKKALEALNKIKELNS